MNKYIFYDKNRYTTSFDEIFRKMIDCILYRVYNFLWIYT